MTFQPEQIYLLIITVPHNFLALIFTVKHFFSLVHTTCELIRHITNQMEASTEENPFLSFFVIFFVVSKHFFPYGFFVDIFDTFFIGIVHSIQFKAIFCVIFFLISKICSQFLFYQEKNSIFFINAFRQNYEIVSYLFEFILFSHSTNKRTNFCNY